MKEVICFFEEKVLIMGSYVSGLALILIGTIEFINVLGRKLYRPLPCAIEGVEALMIIVVFLGVAYLALKGEHINVTIMTRYLPSRFQNVLDLFGNLFGVLVFFILAWGSYSVALKSLMLNEVRIGVYRFPYWPFRIVLAVGLSMLTIQLGINAVRNCLMVLKRSRTDKDRDKEE